MPIKNYLGRSLFLPILFALTLFVSAFLLFWVELMVAKMILPFFGGSPAVWNTCLLFFQTILLLGYGYSHLTTKWLGTRRQTIIHIFTILIPLIFLPITFKRGDFSFLSAHPIIALLSLLTLSIGFPLLAISTTAPLAQKWFSETIHPASSDPYFLYTASSLGSLCGVICYPIFLEPNFSLTHQNQLWTIGYISLLLLTVGCGITLWQIENGDPGSKKSHHTSSFGLEKVTPNLPLKMQWLLLSFLPSSLLLGVTTYLTTDLAAIPLLWAIPLAIYLLTFTFTFAPKPLFSQEKLEKFLPVLLALLIALALLKIIEPLWLLLPLHLIGFFGIAMLFHGKLASSRPHPDYLTSFYFWIAFGGVLGGLFNAIAAPLLFTNILEYPLILGLSMLLIGVSKVGNQNAEVPLNEEMRLKSLLNGDYKNDLFSNPLVPNALIKIRRSLSLISSIILLACFLLTGFQVKNFNDNLTAILFIFGILLLLFYGFSLSRIRFITGLILMSLISQFYLPSMGKLLVTERSFFGVNRVLYNQKENYHSLFHGTTLHGRQSLDPERRDQPLTYFYPTGPIGQVFQSLDDSQPLLHIGVMGLGIGTLITYGKPEQSWTFYEIDESVERLARNPQYFSFLEDTKSPFSIILGDARLSIQKAADHYYNLLIMDAFSSDAIPTHLVTKEAIQLYLQKLSPQGLLAINISNRHLNLEPVLGGLAEDLSLSALSQLDLPISTAEKKLGKLPSHWVILTSDQKNFGKLINDSRWQVIEKDSQVSLWTDDFSNIFQILRIFKAGKSLKENKI
ncbi:MAG: fused MFS/spermidine synthase [Snowella sp.]|nr:fused MFS/spermidine synthase [Snowella sp.]